MTPPFTIEIESRPLMDALNELIQRGQDMAPVLDTIGSTLENRTRARFESKTDPAGVEWHPWLTSTRKQYDRADTVKGKGVVRKGSLLHRSEEGMLGGLSYQVEGGDVRVGFDRFYAYFHEYGTKHMVRRGMLASADHHSLGEGDEQAILDLVKSYFGKPL